METTVPETCKSKTVARKTTLNQVSNNRLCIIPPCRISSYIFKWSLINVANTAKLFNFCVKSRALRPRLHVRSEYVAEWLGHICLVSGVKKKIILRKSRKFHSKKYCLTWIDFGFVLTGCYMGGRMWPSGRKTWERDSCIVNSCLILYW